MNQSSVIFFTLLLAFLIFITQKGELPVYLGLLLLSPPQQAPSSSPSSASSGTNVSNIATQAATFVAQNPEILAGV